MTLKWSENQCSLHNSIKTHVKAGETTSCFISGKHVLQSFFSSFHSFHPAAVKIRTSVTWRLTGLHVWCVWMHSGWLFSSLSSSCASGVLPQRVAVKVSILMFASILWLWSHCCPLGRKDAAPTHPPAPPPHTHTHWACSTSEPYDAATLWPEMGIKKSRLMVTHRCIFPLKKLEFPTLQCLWNAAFVSQFSFTKKWNNCFSLCVFFSHLQSVRRSSRRAPWKNWKASWYKRLFINFVRRKTLTEAPQLKSTHLLCLYHSESFSFWFGWFLCLLKRGWNWLAVIKTVMKTRLHFNLNAGFWYWRFVFLSNVEQMV